MADLAPARPADRPAFAHAVGGKVVIEHELLAVLVQQPFDALLVGDGAESGDHQRLRLAALEDGRPMYSRQRPDLARDIAQLFVRPAVDALAFEDQIAHDALFQVLEC